jgi:hypothetical protein
MLRASNLRLRWSGLAALVGGMLHALGDVLHSPPGCRLPHHRGGPYLPCSTFSPRTDLVLGVAMAWLGLALLRSKGATTQRISRVRRPS